MGLRPSATADCLHAERVVQAYLLGLVDFDASLNLQRRLVYEVAGQRSQAALVLCEHPPLITVGRHGSRRHILCEPDQLRTREWRVRWINRGGGTLLQLPGQLAIYAILALDHFRLGVQTYLDGLHRAIARTLDDFGIRGHTRPCKPGLWVGDRLIAATGIAVRHWVTYYGGVLNINPELTHFRLVECAGRGEQPMTSIARERRAPLRPALVRERLLDHFANEFGFARTSLFSQVPGLNLNNVADALATHS